MESNQRSVLFVSCEDHPGLIYKVTGVLFAHGLNIIENTEFVDHKNKMFFMRTEVEGKLSFEPLLNELKSTIPVTVNLQLMPQEPRRLVLLATKESHCLGDLLLRNEAQELNAKIVAVISQYSSLEPLVKRFDIPFQTVEVGNLSREEHEQALLRAIEPYQPDLLVLAKYMRILTADFVKHYPNRIINIHHSFLPAFIGKNPYAQAYERGVKIIGATAHFVNDQLDEGPIITQSVIPVTHTQDAQSLARAGRDVEKIVLAKALNLVLENRVMVQGSRTLVFD